MSAQRKGPRLRKLSSGTRPKIVTPNRRAAQMPAVLKPVIKLIGPVFKPLGKIVPPYFKNSWTELRQVTWPNRGETWKLTSAVFIFAIVFGGAVLLVDKGLDEFFRKVVLK